MDTSKPSVRKRFEVSATDPMLLRERLAQFRGALRAQGGRVLSVNDLPTTTVARLEVCYELPLLHPDGRSPDGSREPRRHGRPAHETVGLFGEQSRGGEASSAE